MNAIFLLLFLIPAVALAWRIVVSRSSSVLLKAGAAAAVMTTVVGAFVVYDDLRGFEFGDWRSDLALAAAVSGSIYLLLWALRPRTNRRHRTISIIAAIAGLVPFFGSVATRLLFGGR